MADKISAIRIGEDGNLRFQIKGEKKTFLIKGDTPSADVARTMTKIAVKAFFNKSSATISSALYPGEPEYHLVSDIYVGKWK